MYDPEAQRFLPDRYVEGTCPHCGYGDARGDQCDNCGRTLDPIDLINPRSKLSGATPETRDTTHFFLDLPQFQERLQRWVDAESGHWRPAVVGFVQGWLKEGLRPRAITRDLDWGVPIPLEGFEDKRIYVWFDAVIGYLSASMEWAERQGDPDAWKRWWVLDGEGNAPGRSYYFVGKDNTPFHAIIWPAMLMGYGGLALPYDVPANEFLTLDGQKLSSSRTYTSRLPFLPGGARSLRRRRDPVLPDHQRSGEPGHRLLLGRVPAPEQRRASRDLRQRRSPVAVIYPVTFRWSGAAAWPAVDGGRGHAGANASDIRTVGEQIEAVRLRDGLLSVMALASALNRYLDEAAPWKTLKTDPERAATSLWTALQVVSALRVLTAPYLPFSAQQLHEYLGDEGDVHALPWAFRDLPAGRALLPPQPLFRKLDDEELAGLVGRLDEETVVTGEPRRGGLAEGEGALRSRRSWRTWRTWRIGELFRDRDHGKLCRRS